MRYNHISQNVNTALPTLMNHLRVHGEEFGSRAGKTKELMHVGITLTKPWQREIVLTERKANIAAQIVETMWVLSGRNDVAGLNHYLPRAKDFSDDGLEWRAGYGPRLRNFHGIDQLAYIVDTLVENPGSRQAVASIWDPTVDTRPGKDIACNNWLSFSARDGRLDLQVGIRSNDAMWGWSGINAFEWSSLLELVAALTSLEVGQLHFSVTSFHLYEQHWGRAAEIAKGEGSVHFRDSPRMHLGLYNVLARFDELAEEWFDLEEAIRTGHYDVSRQVKEFLDPMLQSWLRVLQWYWSGDKEYLLPLVNTQIYAACLVGMKPPGKPQQIPLVNADTFLADVNRLHAEKHAAYGDSWKRRGEAGILGNIARKVDRIGSGVDTSDETQADTATDLLVYLAKYWCWLIGIDGDPTDVEQMLANLEEAEVRDFNVGLDKLFEMSTDRTLSGSRDRAAIAYEMAEQALRLARSLA